MFVSRREKKICTNSISFTPCKFIDELQQADIISHLSQDTSSDPNENYDKFIEIVLSATN